MATSISQVSANSAAAPADYTSSGNFQKDETESSTDPKFNQVLQKLQAQYGAKAEKPREAKKTLGKDDFLRIMITQMQHQDPTSPFKAEQMAQEMAQFTSVEQMQNMSHSLEKMSGKDQPLERLAMTNLIGKTVTIDRGRFPHTEGSTEALSYSLPREASSVKIAVVSESGETVLEKDLGPQKSGEGSFSWDGLKKNTLPAKSGSYMLRVEAIDEGGKHIDTSTQGKSRVIGVSFEGAEPVFLIGDANRQARVTMRNIVQIDESAGAAARPAAPAPQGLPGSAQPAAAAVAAEPSRGNFFSFQKGVGSNNLDPTATSPEISEALSKYQAESRANADGEAKQAKLNAQATKQSAPQSAPRVATAAPQIPGSAVAAAPSEKGFPNGLQ